MYVMKRAMGGLMDAPRTGMTPISVPNAVFVGANGTTAATAASPTKSYMVPVIVGVLAIGGYFLYKRMKG